MLAACDEPSLVEMYASKLPVMSINVFRLTYTADAFHYCRATVNDDPGTHDAAVSALDFYLKTDARQSKPIRSGSDVTLVTPNVVFSSLLHSLRSNGYVKYVVELAVHLRLHLNFILDHALVFAIRHK